MDQLEKSIGDIVPDGPTMSEPFDFKGMRIRFMLLDIRKTDWARVAAQKHVFDSLMAEFDDKDLVLSLMTGHGPNVDSHKDWQDVYALVAALCKEDGSPLFLEGGRAAALDLADKYSTYERADLVDRYLQFADEHDPATVEDVEEVIEALGKHPEPEHLRQYGSNVLRLCVVTMVSELLDLRARVEVEEQDQDVFARLDALEAEISQMRKSGDGGS